MTIRREFRRLLRLDTDSSRHSAVDDELTFHLESRVDELLRSGACATRAEAEARAEREFGSLSEARRELTAIDARRDRHRRRTEWAVDFGRDLQFAVRSLTRAPGFAVAALLTIVLAIGATTAVFSIVNGVLLEALPFTAPEKLVELTTTHHGDDDDISPLDLIDLQREARSFVGLASVQTSPTYRLRRSDGTTIQMHAARVGSNFFALLGTAPLLGRFFGAQDTVTGAPLAVVLSEGSWRNEFGGDSTVVQRTITLNDEPARIVGVAPASLEFPDQANLWVPTVWQAWEIAPDNRGARMLRVLARVKPGVSLATASAELRALFARLAAAYPTADKGYEPRITPLRDRLLGGVARALWAVFGAVVCVLLIGCANVANLLLVRMDAREPEIAVRRALGASAARITRLVLAEGLVLAGIGTAIGVALAAGAVHVFLRYAPQKLPRLGDVTIDGRVLLFAIGATIFSALLFTAAPALRLGRRDAIAGLRRSGGRTTRDGNRMRGSIVVIETALAVVLVIGAALLAQSLWRLLSVDPGFRSSNLVAFDIRAGSKYGRDAQARALAAAVLERLRALPGAQSAAVAAARPLDPDNSFDATTSFTVQGRPPEPNDRRPVARILPVSADYFRTLGIPIRRGRGFLPNETDPIPHPVIVVDEAFARAQFPTEDPIGHEIDFDIAHDTSAAPGSSMQEKGTIVGVVGNATAFTLQEHHTPTAYIGYGRLPFGMSFLVRSTAAPATLESGIRQIVHDIDPTIALYSMQTMQQALSTAVAEPRLYTVLLAVFAGLALLLAAVGLYSLTMYTVRLRTREFGIRLALGASGARLESTVLREGVMLALLGVLLGLLAASAATRVLGAMLFGLSPIDWPSFAAGAATLVLAAAVASWLPARRAARMDPTIAMRSE